MVEEGLDLCRTQFRGVALAVEQNELADPIAIGLLGVAAEMAAPANDGNLVEQPGPVGGCVTP
jgi:hypothetical protein